MGPLGGGAEYGPTPRTSHNAAARGTIAPRKLKIHSARESLL